MRKPISNSLPNEQPRSCDEQIQHFDAKMLIFGGDKWEIVKVPINRKQHVALCLGLNFVWVLCTILINELVLWMAYCFTIPMQKKVISS